MKSITVLLIAIVCMTAISSCALGPVPFFPHPTETPTSTPTPIPSPTPTPMPPFQGTLLLRIRSGYSDVTVYKLVYDGRTWTTTGAPVIEGAQGAVLSPDGSHLFVYQGEADGVKVIDLLSDEETTFQTPEDLGDMTSMSISPDSTNFCYATSSGKVYLYTISLGKPRLVYKAPFANYSFSNGDKYSVYGETGCGLWLGADRFVMYRYIGSMPRHVTSPGYPEVAANTTTIVTIGEKFKLENAKQLVSVEAISPDDLSIVYTDKKDGAVYLARNFSSFKELDSQLIVRPASDQVAFFEFLPDDQVLYTVSTRGDRGLLYPDYSIINLADMELRKWELPDDCGYGLRNGKGWEGGSYERSWQWIGEPGSGVIACVDTDISEYVSEVFVADVATGAATSIFKLESDGLLMTEGEIIGWLP
jgi:WD40 repeat protein